MPSDTLFVDPRTGDVNTDQIMREAVPLAKLIGIFGVIALVPLALLFLIGPASLVGAVLTFISQFILAVGTGIILLYVVTRALELAEFE